MLELSDGWFQVTFESPFHSVTKFPFYGTMVPRWTERKNGAQYYFPFLHPVRMPTHANVFDHLIISSVVSAAPFDPLKHPNDPFKWSYLSVKSIELSNDTPNLKQASSIGIFHSSTRLSCLGLDASRLGLLTFLLHLLDLPKLQVMSLVFCLGAMVSWLLNLGKYGWRLVTKNNGKHNSIWVWYLKIIGNPIAIHCFIIIVSSFKIGNIGGVYSVFGQTHHWTWKTWIPLSRAYVPGFNGEHGRLQPSDWMVFLPLSQRIKSLLKGCTVTFYTWIQAAKQKNAKFPHTHAMYIGTNWCLEKSTLNPGWIAFLGFLSGACRSSRSYGFWR